MDVAQRIARWAERPPEQWLAAANRYLPAVATAALTVAIAYQLAAITWALAPGEPLDRPAPAVAFLPAGAPASPGASADLGILVRAHLFGKAPEQTEAPRPVAVEAPDTTLSLRLTGVVADEDGELARGVAIIASGRSQEKVYRIGQVIEGGNGATLHSVHADHVLLERGGGLERLRLPDLSNGAGPAMTRSAPPMPAPAADPQPAALRQVITSNANQLTNIIRFAPHVEGGQVVGFRVNPGRDREAFAALGLEPGDVVTDINGAVINDAQGGLQAFEALGEATMANVTIMRDGAPQVIVIDTTQLESLAEGRQ